MVKLSRCPLAYFDTNMDSYFFLTFFLEDRDHEKYAKNYLHHAHKKCHTVTTRQQPKSE